MEIQEICKQRWESIRELERTFMASPDEENGIILSDLWNNWLGEAWARSNGSGEIAGKRMNLFYDYVAGRKIEEEVVEYLEQNALPEFKGLADN